MGIYITFLLSFPRARHLYHIESLQPLEQIMIDAALKELRKETRCTISIFKNPRNINCWEETHRRLSDLLKLQTNADELVDFFLSTIFCTYCGKS